MTAHLPNHARDRQFFDLADTESKTNKQKTLFEEIQ